MIHTNDVLHWAVQKCEICFISSLKEKPNNLRMVPSYLDLYENWWLEYFWFVTYTPTPTHDRLKRVLWVLFNINKQHNLMQIVC